MRRINVRQYLTSLLLKATRPVGVIDWELQLSFLDRETRLQLLADVTCVLTAGTHLDRVAHDLEPS